MSRLTIALLCILLTTVAYSNVPGLSIGSSAHPVINAMPDIDSLDLVIFDFDQITIEGNIIQVPVFIESDDVINSLDFSMLLNIENVEFESIVDHTGGLQYAAFLNPNDLKLRFTSNSFSSYPKQPQKVVSIRFKVLRGIVRLSDFQMIIAYLNGERSSDDVRLQGEEIFVSSKEIVTGELFISPNPATDILYVSAEETGTMDIYDIKGVPVLQGYLLTGESINQVDVQSLPRGTYTVRIVNRDQIIKIQKIVLQ
jgi:Secretion system C-terminal sorting domain